MSLPPVSFRLFSAVSAQFNSIQFNSLFTESTYISKKRYQAIKKASFRFVVEGILGFSTYGLPHSTRKKDSN